MLNELLFLLYKLKSVTNVIKYEMKFVFLINKCQKKSEGKTVTDIITKSNIWILI